MNKKILLVADDEPMSRAIIQRNFHDVFEVLEAKDGAETLEILHSRRVDIAILDIMMPKHDGFEVLQKVKCDEKYSDLRVIVATSMHEATERKALEMGADDIVFKPYDPVVIKKRLDNLLTMQDQKRELEEALLKAERANQAKTEFLSRISHDMRTPLNGILGITALLKDSVKEDKTYQDVLQLEMSGKYLLNLINDTLDVNKIEIGKLELHPGVYDGRVSFDNIIELIRPNVDKKKIIFNAQLDNSITEQLYIDMGRLQQMIMNILGNAVKFTPEGGAVDFHMINVSRTKDIVYEKIIISDNGPGMSGDFLPHLFEPFTQENPGSTGNSNGTGLGMTITRQIVELMGGTIEVESTIGKGTTFTLNLPLKIATLEQREKWKKETDFDFNGYNYDNIRILLCEDHPLNAEIVIRLLSKKGIIVEHAKDGREGLDMFASSEAGYYDLILMDIRMPVMDGLEATKAIRKLSRKDAFRIPIIAMTANAFDEDIEQTRMAGMNAHLGKPIEIDKVLSCIAQMLHLRKQYNKKKILVVDDIEMNRRVISEALSDEFDIIDAEDGYKALSILEKTHDIELIITDIQMPKMNGLELIKRIRANSQFDKIQIIANTQFGDPEQEEMIIDLGADDFVYKPTTPKIIELRVRNTINKI